MHILNFNFMKLDILMVCHTLIESGFFGFLVFHKIKVHLQNDGVVDLIQCSGSFPGGRHI